MLLHVTMKRPIHPRLSERATARTSLIGSAVGVSHLTNREVAQHPAERFIFCIPETYPGLQSKPPRNLVNGFIVAPPYRGFPPPRRAFRLVVRTSVLFRLESASSWDIFRHSVWDKPSGKRQEPGNIEGLHPEFPRVESRGSRIQAWSRWRGSACAVSSPCWSNWRPKMRPYLSGSSCGQAPARRRSTETGPRIAGRHPGHFEVAGHSD